MKRILAITLALVLCLAMLAGCNKNQQAAAAPAATGTTQTVGALTVFVPNGWNLVTEEAQEDQVYIVKGGTDLNTCPYVKLALGSALPAENLCTNVQLLEARNYGSLSWSGFSGIKSGGHVIYLVAETQGTNLLATLWCTASALSLEDQAVQQLLGGISVTAPTQPESTEPPATEAPTSVVGDWTGEVEFVDCSGELESKNGSVYQAIARVLVDESGNMTPYIGLAPEAGSITGLSAPVFSDEMSTSLSGDWNGIPFEGCQLHLEGGKLQTQISINAENKYGTLVFSFTPLTDGSFDALASQLGCTGYPGK